jgi:hypothetical protein
MRQRLTAATLVAIALAPGSTGAQMARDYGTPRDACLMLERVIGALQTDEAKAPAVEVIFATLSLPGSARPR